MSDWSEFPRNAIHAIEASKKVNMGESEFVVIERCACGSMVFATDETMQGAKDLAREKLCRHIRTAVMN